MAGATEKGGTVSDVGTSLTLEDRRQLEVLYERLWRFGAVIAPPGVDADDLVQEAMVRVLSRSSLAEIRHPVAYLRRTMVHVASNQRRRLGTQRRALARLSSSSDPHRDAYPSDLTSLLTLSPQARAILFLSEVEGYHFDEIGRMLGCSEQAARKAASRGRRRLREQLDSEAMA